MEGSRLRGMLSMSPGMVGRLLRSTFCLAIVAVLITVGGCALQRPSELVGKWQQVGNTDQPDLVLELRSDGTVARLQTSSIDWQELHWSVSGLRRAQTDSGTRLSGTMSFLDSDAGGFYDVPFTLDTGDGAKVLKVDLGNMESSSTQQIIPGSSGTWVPVS